MRIRVALGVLGTAMVGFGALRLLGSPRHLLDVGVWLAGGVLVHDALLAPLALALAWLGVRVVPATVRPVTALALVVLATVTVTAVPVLGRFGARADNPTLLDRDYVTGWLLLAGAVTAVALAALLLGRIMGRQRGGEG